MDRNCKEWIQRVDWFESIVQRLIRMHLQSLVELIEFSAEMSRFLNPIAMRLGLEWCWVSFPGKEREGSGKEAGRWRQRHLSGAGCIALGIRLFAGVIMAADSRTETIPIISRIDGSRQMMSKRRRWIWNKRWSELKMVVLATLEASRRKEVAKDSYSLPPSLPPFLPAFYPPTPHLFGDCHSSGWFSSANQIYNSFSFCCRTHTHIYMYKGIDKKHVGGVVGVGGVGGVATNTTNR